jgi:antitoxin (DNA-binding transcriptional repressor) of toxin-antitoxin stability system
MAQYSVREAKTQLSKLISEAIAGGDVVVARRKIPAVRLVPVIRCGKRSFGALKGKLVIDACFDGPLPEDELAGWSP